MQGIAAGSAGPQFVDANSWERAIPVDIEVESGAASRAARGRRAGAGRPPMRLGIDASQVDQRGVLSIEGWALSLTPIESVMVSAGGNLLGAAEHGRKRPEVAPDHDGYPNAGESGFAFKCYAHDILDAGRHELAVTATAIGGVSRSETVAIEVRGSGRPTARSKRIRHHWDEIQLTRSGLLTLSGWMFSAVDIKTVELAFDGTPLGSASYGGERPDVGNKYPRIAQARRSGFRFTARLAQPQEGEHEISLTAVNREGEETTFLVPVQAVDIGPEGDVAPPSGVAESMHLFLDAPIIVEGKLDRPIRNGLAIVGWAVARDGIARVEFHLDGHLVGECYYGIRRPDVAKTYPDWPNSDLSGYAVSLPAKTLPAGIHSLRITAFDRVGGSRDIEFSVEIEPAVDLQGPWSLRRTVRPAETRSRLQQIAQLGKPTTFCLLLAARTATTDSLGPTIRSLTRQVFADWRIAILLEKGGELKLEPSLAAMLESYAPNVYVVDFDEHATIAGIVRHIRPADRSCYVLMVECGDELGADALLMLALARATDPMADFLYSDERCVSATGKTEAFFKPGWSPSLLLSTDYLGRAWCAHADLFSKAGVTIGDFIRRGCYELALRLTERAARIVRVPCVLFDSSRAQVPAGIVPNHEILGRNLRRRGIQADILPGRAPHSYFVARRTEHRPLVSIIIPTCGSRDLIKICLATLREKTAYKNYEVICVDNSPEDRVEFKQWLRETSDVVIEFLEPFNWSLFNNLGVKEAAGDLLLFLNDDIEIEDENWLGVLVEHALRPEIGIVGPQLLYPDRKVQHAGLFLSGRDSARHAFRFAREDDPGYFGLALLEREV
ncbi:MAG: glycosyltransferase, partial [Methylobacteriaceae bacterium]|nr:glycosyltransferase [Methylobacteriaceae bacterium]